MSYRPLIAVDGYEKELVDWAAEIGLTTTVSTDMISKTGMLGITERIMKTIEIDERIYELLLHQTTRFGESPSEVIERLVNGSAKRPGNGQTQQHQGALGSAAQQKAPPRTFQDPLGAFLNGPSFLVQGNAIGRFLAILSWLCNQHPQSFEEVLRLNGRKRKYFARSAEELEASGTSVMPKRIPDTPYWVVSNSPTQLKRQITADVFRMLGYDGSSTQRAVEAIR